MGRLIAELETRHRSISGLLVLRTVISSITQDGFTLLVLEDKQAVK